ncbi:MAG: formyltransferase family protein [Alphaproteobacteria bacterium]|nr:formyltransferase family protein [Alphaproteobacteria bacterium]
MPSHKKILFITGSERRHQFMRMAIAADPSMDVALSVCEGAEMSLKNRMADASESSPILRQHIEGREQSEEDFFQSFCQTSPDLSHSMIVPKGDINADYVLQKVAALGVEYVACFGTSILKAPWFKAFPDRILNLHLGLSPYYRGSGTNFWAMYHGRFECVGATFMLMDDGIDTGKIIHQIRAKVMPGDNAHIIGNRLIRDAASAYVSVIKNFGPDTKFASKDFFPSGETLCRRKDFTAEFVEKFYNEFASKLNAHIKNAGEKEKQVPIFCGSMEAS